MVLVDQGWENEEDALGNVHHDVCRQDRHVWLGTKSHNGDESVRVVLYGVLGECGVFEAIDNVEDKQG